MGGDRLIRIGCRTVPSSALSTSFSNNVDYPTRRSGWPSLTVMPG